MDKDSLLQNVLPRSFSGAWNAAHNHSILVLPPQVPRPSTVPTTRVAILKDPPVVQVFSVGEESETAKKTCQRVGSRLEGIRNYSYNQDLFRDGNLESPKGGQKIVQ